MKELTTFMGNSGKSMAIIYEAPDRTYWKVNFGETSAPHTFSRIFMTESEAIDFASMITNDGSEPSLLNE